MIEVENLTKHFRQKQFKKIVAVDGVSFRVENGEVLGLLGPNGAGKTTIMRMIAAMLKPVDGTARVSGYDVRTYAITLPLGGGMLERVARIDMAGLQPEIRGATISVACDVTNPLCGPKGASHVYGNQKGATPEMIETLDRNLAHLAGIIRRDLGDDVAERPGAGAAGGMGAGLMAFAGATLKRGVGIVVEVTKLDKHMQGASLATTGEGRVDFQTAFGKTPSGVAMAARRHGVPVVVIGGGVADDAGGVFSHGIAINVGFQHFLWANSDEGAPIGGAG